jgi:hypothetical protein
MMRNKTKEPTAVQWLMEQITYTNEFGCVYNSFVEYEDLSRYFAQAKEMEANQHNELIEKSYKEGSDYTINLMEKIAREKLDGM